MRVLNPTGCAPACRISRVYAFPRSAREKLSSVWVEHAPTLLSRPICWRTASKLSWPFAPLPMGSKYQAGTDGRWGHKYVHVWTPMPVVAAQGLPQLRWWCPGLWRSSSKTFQAVIVSRQKPFSHQHPLSQPSSPLALFMHPMLPAVIVSEPLQDLCLQLGADVAHPALLHGTALEAEVILVIPPAAA